LSSLSDADTEVDFVLMTSAYSQYLMDSCKQHIFSTSLNFEVNPILWVYGSN